MNNIIYKYFDLSTDQKVKINKMYSVYEFWNQKVNLISRKDFHYFYERHVLHSLSISKCFSFKSNSKIMDVGTGGGFPGVPLAIFFPEVQFFLVDSISKKTSTLKSIVNELELNNVMVLNERVEEIDDKFDFIVCRAVAKLQKLNQWTCNKVSKKHLHKFKNGLICLKGGDLQKEIQQFISNVNIYSISDFFEEDFFYEKKIIHLSF